MAKKIKLDESLFDYDDDDTENEWKGMPEFNQPDNGAFRQLLISFDTQEDIDEFSKLINQNITSKTKSLWYPPRPKNNVVDLFYFDIGNSNGST